MIEASITAWAFLLGTIFASSVAGLLLSRCIPWSNAARVAGIPRAFGIACAPFLLGLLSVIALGLFRFKSHEFHLGVVCVALIGLCAVAPMLPAPIRPRPLQGRTERSPLSWVLGALLVAYMAILIVFALFVPLTQNDGLEYAIVGRTLYESRDLLSYPVLNSGASPSGFYGPWTHPPLYVSLIYIANVIQGNADAPGLMRLISPWCALSATGLVYAIGCMGGRVTGMLAAVFTLSTPMFFLGAGSSLIDPLPVLGISLVLCSVIAVEGKAVICGVVQGLTLGCTLWAHSQAVLFVPLSIAALTLKNGWREPRPLLLQAIVLLGISGLIAAWPYGRNFHLFGSIISDNPAVFALKELRWAEYFSMARGLESWPEKIQYGILKGWFALEAYSLAFWCMSLGMALYVARLHRRHIWAQLRQGYFSQVPEHWLFVPFCIVLIYIGGAFLSALLGIDQMMRSERYMLVILPCVAILAGSGIYHWAWQPSFGPEERDDSEQTHPKARYRVVKSAAIVLFFTAQLIVFGGYRWLSPVVAAGQTGHHKINSIRQWPAYGAIEYLRHNAPLRSVVFTMKPSDMYYSEHRMLSYLDPRLIAFYLEADVGLARQRLRELGVSHLHIPDYSLPPVYNSVLQEMIARPDIAQLVFSSDGYQIYKLRDDVNPFFGTIRDISPGAISWTQVCQLVLGGRKSILRLPLSSRVMSSGEVSHPCMDLPFFQRESAQIVLSGTDSVIEVNAAHDLIPVSGTKEYRLELALEGHAWVQVYLYQYDKAGRLLNQFMAGEIALAKQDSKRRFERRFISHQEAASVRIGIEHRGNSSLRVVKASLITLSR